MQRACLFLLVLAACGDDASTSGDDAPRDGAPVDETVEPFEPLEGVGAVELVMGGFSFVEGPQWRDTEGDLLFTDIPESTIFRLKDGTVSPLSTASGMANGLALDGTGTLLSARHGSRNVVRGDTELVGEFESLPFNSPNDLVVGSDGSVFFTDPPYGLPNNTTSALGFMGVFQYRPDQSIEALHRGGVNERPNGIGLSPDNTHLYYADTAQSKLFVYLLAGDPPGRTEFATTASGPDGLAIDSGGNIFVTSMAGIEVFKPDGTRVGAIPVPEKPANCAFGDPDHKTLYITAQTGLYKVRLAHAGLPTH